MPPTRRRGQAPLGNASSGKGHGLCDTNSKTVSLFLLTCRWRFVIERNLQAPLRKTASTQSGQLSESWLFGADKASLCFWRQLAHIQNYLKSEIEHSWTDWKNQAQCLIQGRYWQRWPISKAGARPLATPVLRRPLNRTLEKLNQHETSAFLSSPSGSTSPLARLCRIDVGVVKRHLMNCQC